MSDTYIAAHASVAAAVKAAAPLPSAHTEICQLLEDHVCIDPASGAVTVLDSDGSVALDRDAGFIPMTPAKFMSTVKASRPWLFDETAKPQRSTASAPASTTTLTALMSAAKKGDPAARAALTARMKI